MKAAKLVSVVVLFLLCSSIFALAQETDNQETVAEECGLGCTVWQFFFGSQEARAGRAWFDRSALVGEAGKTPTYTYTGKMTVGGVLILKDADGFLYLQSQEDPKTITAQPAGTLIILERLPDAPSSYAQGKIFTPPVAAQNVNLGDVVVTKGPQLVDIPTWTKETDAEFKKSGTVYKNDKGEFFITNADGTGVKATEAAAFKKFKENEVAAKIQPQAKSNLESILGKNTYGQYAKTLKVKEVFTREDGTLVMRGAGGVITVHEDKEFGVQVVERAQGGSLLETSIARDGQILATQTPDGKVKVGEKSYNFPKDQKISDSLGDLEEGIQLPGKEGPSGFMKLEEDVFTAVDYEKETMQRTNTKTGEEENLKVDYYKDGVSGCGTKGGCVVPTGGTATLSGQRYLVDYEYKTTGADRAKPENVEEVEYFNPLTGNQEGTKLTDGTSVFAERKLNDKGQAIGYTGLYEVTLQTGDKALMYKDENGKWATKELVDGPDQDATVQADDFLSKPEILPKLEAIESTSQGDSATARGVIQSIYAITNNLKSYPAISNLLFGETDFFRNWRAQQDAAFAPLLGENIWNSVICEVGFNHWQDLEPEGKAILKTPSGTYQTIASIQMERSPETSPILCHKNPDEESEELFICDSKQVCIDENFCYADQDRDNDPDSKEPLKGYFYKVTWAVSAPQDETFTPLVDENGVAVSFNIFLYPGAVPMYNSDGNVASPIQLQNGDRDRDAIIKYSTEEYDRACIVWNQPPLTAGSAGGVIGGALTFGAADAREPIGEVCFDRYDDEGNEIDGFISKVGQVNWERSGQEAASVTVSHGQVSRNTDW
ncbi:MAG: hypothetical protein Q7S55_01120 [Nanoarchaeota archaeon]|nr:hypothetical protein [Nanoarchaeota archaeon]